MAEHSPAPWHTGTDEDGHIVYDTNADFVADVGQDDDAELEEANLHLITATPKLLAACKRFLESHQAAKDTRAIFDRDVGKPCCCGPCVEARAAVAEATGQKGA